MFSTVLFNIVLEILANASRKEKDLNDILIEKKDGKLFIDRQWDLVVVVQLLSCVQLFETLRTAHQASLSFTISQSLLKFMSIESVMLSNHLILCCHLLLLPSILPSIRVFSNELVLCIRAKVLELQHQSIQ